MGNMQSTDDYGSGSGGAPPFMMYLASGIVIFMVVWIVFWPDTFPIKFPWNTTTTTEDDPNPPLAPRDGTGTRTGTGTGSGSGSGSGTGTGSVSGTGTGTGSTGAGPGTNVGQMCRSSSECSSGCCSLNGSDGPPRCVAAGMCSNSVTINGNFINVKNCAAADNGKPPWVRIYRNPNTNLPSCIGDSKGACKWSWSAVEHNDLNSIKTANPDLGYNCQYGETVAEGHWCQEATKALNNIPSNCK